MLALILTLQGALCCAVVERTPVSICTLFVCFVSRCPRKLTPTNRHGSSSKVGEKPPEQQPCRGGDSEADVYLLVDKVTSLQQKFGQSCKLPGPSLALQIVYNWAPALATPSKVFRRVSATSVILNLVAGTEGQKLVSFPALRPLHKRPDTGNKSKAPSSSVTYHSSTRHNKPTPRQQLTSSDSNFSITCRDFPKSESTIILSPGKHFCVSICFVASFFPNQTLLLHNTIHSIPLQATTQPVY